MQVDRLEAALGRHFPTLSLFVAGEACLCVLIGTLQTDLRSGLAYDKNRSTEHGAKNVLRTSQNTPDAFIVKSAHQFVGLVRHSTATHTPSIGNNVRADVCIVGAGIAGMTTAYLLAREGQSVVLIDKNQVGHGETSHASAHLSSEIDAGYRQIEHLHGEEGARLVAQSHGSAISKIESIVDEEDIECGFERLDGYLFLGPKNVEKDLREEFDAARRAGMKVKQLERVPFDLDLGPCLQFRQQAQFHPSGREFRHNRTPIERHRARYRERSTLEE